MSFTAACPPSANVPPDAALSCGIIAAAMTPDENQYTGLLTLNLCVNSFTASDTLECASPSHL